MVDKVSFSSYVRTNFRNRLIHSSKKKSKADNIYHSNYVSINRYLEEFSDDTLNTICHKISQRKYKCELLTPIILPKTNCLKSSVLSVDNTRLVCVPSVQDRILQKLFIRYLKEYYNEIYIRFCEHDHALNKDIKIKKSMLSIVADILLKKILMASVKLYTRLLSIEISINTLLKQIS